MQGILGGSFDPIHNGHLAVAQAAYEKLALKELYFLPCGQASFNKTLQASKAARLTMLQLALQDKAHFRIDRQELDRDGPSYTIDTLKNFRLRIGQQESLVWVLGYDAFLSLPQWHAWPSILNYCHWLIVTRALGDNTLPPILKEVIQQRATDAIQQLRETPAGKLYFLDMPAVDVTSAQIRSQVNHSEVLSPAIPAAVLHYIKTNQVYKNSFPVR